ncbi:uncharacterized protein [Argopecten irradians]|uniref:uncharacterized protein isoform X2 n=1 Tax=Argopecten irradians TaxID=31199 RepID=UPI003720B103
MQTDLNDVVSKVREIGELLSSLEATLKRSLIHSRDNALHLIQDTDRIFANIIEKTLTAQETLKTHLSSLCNPLARPQCQVRPVSTNTEPKPSSLMSSPTIPAFSVKLPLQSSVDLQDQHIYKELSTPTHHATQPGVMELNYGNSTGMPFGGYSNSRHLEPPFDNRKRMAMDSVKPDQQMLKQGSFPCLASFNLDFTSMLGVAMPGLEDLQNRFQGYLQQHIQTSVNSHLITWMTDHIDSDTDPNVRFKRVTELGAESSNCILRGLQQIPAFLESDNLSAVVSFIPEVDKEFEKVEKTQRLPVRGDGPDTVLCLDTSASMSGENFQTMITVVNKIINGIEELTNYEELQENIAVTTFGSNPRVVTHLTNDYNDVRDSIQSLHAEGPSKLYRGLAMAVAACIGNYSEVNINDVRLMPRIIVVTDGKFSSYHRHTGEDTFDPMNAIMIPYAAKIMKMSGQVCYCVKIGTADDSEILKTLTQITNGKIYSPDQVDELAMMSKYLFAATRLLRQLPDLVDGDEEAKTNDKATLHALLDLERESRGAFGRGFSESEKKTVVELAINISKRESTKIAEQNEYEVEELPDLQLPPLGTRVRRGPDWIGTDYRDSFGPGTVVNHKNNGTVDVIWDCGIMPCNYNCNDPCEVLPTDTDERIVEDGELIPVGCRVIRADGWNKGDEDGGPGVCGVVRWHGGIIGKYRYGEEVKFLDTSDDSRLAEASGYDDTKIASGAKLNPEKKLNLTSYQLNIRDSNSQFLYPYTNDFSSETMVNTPLEEMSKEDFDSREPFVWSFRQEGRGNWTQFDSCNNRKLESEWSRRSKTSVVSLNGKGYRVVFAKMAMTYTPVNQEKTPVTAKVKREERLETCDDEQMPEESIKQERKEADIQVLQNNKR